MTAQTRAHLRQEFQNGERPDGDDFGDFIDSSPNLLDDGLSIGADNTLVLARGLRLGDSTDAQPGTLRFNAGQPQYHDGTGFVNFGGGGGGAFQQVGAGADIAYTGGGTVGIGSFAAPAPYRLDVTLGANTGTAEQVRFGTAVICRGTAAQASAAHFAHQDRASNTDFALRQRQTGEVSVNAPTGAPIFLSQGGSAAGSRLTVSPSGAVLIAAIADLSADPQFVLQVNGNAIKSAPGGSWQISSDLRVKENVADYRAGLAEVRGIRPVSFRYNGKAGTLRGAEGVGVIGQEIERILPETVELAAARLDDETGEVTDLRLYNDSALVYALVNAVKELAARVEALERAAGGGSAPAPGV